ncbi:aldehyde dehydrogenase [Agaribacter marinus]|uniref:Aldehyde dehydrogenase n=1 Tax=Agaribacter marinus TaxID=1431249 RepID=A0AA37SYK0_9ALTE|nr:aldehyde dehydrogenase [Agaribacter marinus]GLR72432.1 aldehyde dehydrogenase [Agaribacter marinus]
MSNEGNDNVAPRSIPSTVSTHQRYFATGVTKEIDWRLKQLKALQRLIRENEVVISEALSFDLGKGKHEAYLTEIGFVLSDIKLALKKLSQWHKPIRVGSPLVAFPAKSYMLPEPLGCALIIGAWNYPIQLTLSPLVAGIAAGNCAVIKPSELATNTSRLLAKLIPNYLDAEAFSVVEGGKGETQALLACQFDKIFYTGGEAVGKIVMTAAAKFLTPVTLELGGKSPCIVDASANIEIAASRIVWGKFMNAGQTCVAPDYLLVQRSIKQPLLDAIIRQIERQYGKNPLQNKDYGRVINERHFERLRSYLAGQNIVWGGNSAKAEKFIEPTIVLNPDSESKLMQDEIFGPILPILCMDSGDDMLEYASNRPKPLAAYLFTQDEDVEKKFVQRISAGNMCINDTNLFMVNHNLAFGGVGASGMGQYHGKHGFDCFSHYKSVMSRSNKFEVSLRYAPFSRVKSYLLKKLL